FGLRCRPAVRILYETKKGRQHIYLSCDRPAQLARLVKELQLKAEAASLHRSSCASAEKPS
ncbi:MAG: hypothetical protein H5T63_07670, partial [Chloroflexi bacterium]|nr:hypothetical protein [Chloroflexota bacterium]